MYGGHVGIALAGKGIRRTLPLWLLLVATQLPDWTDAAVCTAGISSSPSEMLSHSLPAIAVLAAVVSLLYYAGRRDAAGSALVACVVVSHALVDYLTGIKPTWPGGPTIGLHLYQRPAIDFLIEGVLILAGWMVYRRSLPDNRRNSAPAILLLVSVLLLQLAASASFALFPGLRKC
jgi:hypothetical protein